MLLPKLLEPADHATAANLLIAHLAEATRLGAAAEALIRLPVLATLGLLTVDAGTAKKLLTAVLNVSLANSMASLLFLNCINLLQCLCDLQPPSPVRLTVYAIGPAAYRSWTQCGCMSCHLQRASF